MNRPLSAPWLCAAALLVAAACLAAALACPAQGLAQARKVGGPCAYEDVPARFTILSVEPLPPRPGQPEPPYPPYRALFTVKPERDVPELAHQLGRPHALTLTGGQDPGPAFLKRYGVRPGATFSGRVRLIRSGTCTPFLFDLDGVDTADHFEGRRP